MPNAESMPATAWAALALSVATLIASGCEKSWDRLALRLATTTSIRDSGLLEKLIPVFERECGCRVDVIAVGSGAALNLGAAGDADVLLVHAPDAEESFITAGHGVRRDPFMFNHYTIIGPPHDPAHIRGRSAVNALRIIGAGRFSFTSRGDNSGTHQRELELWKEAGGRPDWEGYTETGQGMGPTLVIAHQLQSYTLVDQGTYLNFQEKIELVPLVTKSDKLRNVYSVIVVDPRKHPRINVALAHRFADYLLSRAAAALISQHVVAGQPLFAPWPPQ